MQVYDTDKIAGVNALVVEYFDRFGSREMRLWVEPVKGTILRVQEFGGPNQEILVKDSLVTSLEFDQNFPPAELINTIREVGNVQLTTQPGQAEPGQPALVPVSPLATRIPPIIEPAPSWLDLGKTHLSFQFTNNLEISSQISGTASSPAQLFADGYFLANIQFGLPWMLRCDRSIDGLRIAFNTGSDGTSIPDDGLRWIDLRNPTVVYEPAPSMHVEEFAFSTDGSQIAFIGKEKTSNLKAIYILDLSTGEAKKIISIRDGRSLTWSPDQESLAWIGQLENSQDVEALLVHVRTGLISFRDTFPQNGDTSQLDWPMANWGKIFPTSMGGLEKCASLPDQ